MSCANLYISFPYYGTEDGLFICADLLFFLLDDKIIWFHANKNSFHDELDIILNLLQEMISILLQNLFKGGS